MSLPHKKPSTDIVPVESILQQEGKQHEGTPAWEVSLEPRRVARLRGLREWWHDLWTSGLAGVRQFCEVLAVVTLTPGVAILAVGFFVRALQTTVVGSSVLLSGNFGQALMDIGASVLVVGAIPLIVVVWSSGRAKGSGPVLDTSPKRDWSTARSPWELTVTSTGPESLTLLTRAIAYRLPATVNLRKHITYVDLPAQSDREAFGRMLAAIEPIPSTHLGGDVEDVRRLAHQAGVDNTSKRLPADVLSLERAQDDLGDLLGQDLTLTSMELLDMGLFAWCTPDAAARAAEQAEQEKKAREALAKARAEQDKVAQEAEEARRKTAAEREKREAENQKAIEKAIYAAEHAPGRRVKQTR